MRLHKLFEDDLVAMRNPLSSALSRSRVGALLLLVSPWFGVLAVIIAPGDVSGGADRMLFVICAFSFLTGAFMFRFPDRVPFVLTPIVGSSAAQCIVWVSSS